MAIDPVEGEWGNAIPPYQHHSITTHIPSWQSAVDIGERKPEMLAAIKNMYPRVILHRDVKALGAKICQAIDTPKDHTCLLFPTLDDARLLVSFCTDPKRGDSVMKEEEFEIKAFDIDIRYYAVFVPAAKMPTPAGFWSDAGVGITSRSAEGSLKEIDRLKEVALDSPAPKRGETPARRELQVRIADLLERAPVGGERSTKVKPEDVYFYQSGMASIFWTTQYLTHSARAGTTVMYGYAFHSTPHTLENFSKAWKIFGRGTEEELHQMGEWLAGEKAAGQPVQAIWAEFPANPMMTTPNLARLRKLATAYDIPLIIDDTIGSFCNVDVMGEDGADIVITSLSKTFSGYADLLMGSATLNPLSRIYDELKALYSEKYSDDMYPADLEALEKNSRNYLERSKIYNTTAQTVVDFFQSKAADNDSSLTGVLYPSVLPQKPNYDARMRVKTPDFTPGYGCLLSVEFEDVESTRAFYDFVGKYLHIGPHLGAHKTLVLAYVKGIYGQELEHAKEFGLDQRQIRISVGFEDEPERLVEIFRMGLEEADKAKIGAGSNGYMPNVTKVIS